MGVLSDQSIFTTMKQNGPFAVGDHVSLNQPFSSEHREWVNLLRKSEVETTKYRAIRGQIFNLLGIEKFSDITPLIQSDTLRRERGERAYQLLARLFNIDASSREIVTKVREFASTADSVIYYLQTKVLTPFSTHIEISNEIETTTNPVELLLMLFDDRYYKKVRLEAKRKLVLMNLAGSIDQRERETNIETKFSMFLNFLNDYVWSPGLKIGEYQYAYLLSEHDPADYRCTKVDVVDEEAARGIKLGALQKLTPIKRRMFRQESGDIPVYVSVRKKAPAAKVLKLLRKNEKNPAVAVDDELGLMAVLDGKAEVKRFVNHLTKAALKANSFMSLEDISDTLTGGRHAASSTGSSSQTRMLKFFARLGSIRVEFIIHTNQSYLDYRFQHGVSHDEYEVRRIFDSGVAEFLFPDDIYHLNMPGIRRDRLRHFRTNNQRKEPE